jgi:hypothetical protein
MAHRVQQGSDKQHYSNKATEPLRQMQVVYSQGNASEHQQTQGADGVVGPVLQVNQLIKSPLTAQHQGEGANKQGSKA